MKSETGNKTFMYFNLPQNDFMPNTYMYYFCAFYQDSFIPLYIIYYIFF